MVGKATAEPPADAKNVGARIELCGELGAEIGSRRIGPALRHPQSRALFAYLVLHRNALVTRAELVEALWPHDHMPEHPDAVLSGVLSRVRKSLGDGVLVGRSQLALNLGDAHVDVELADEAAQRADAAVERGDHAAAAAAADAGLELLQRGALLPGLDAPWIDEKRRELEETEIRLTEARIRAALAMRGSHLGLAERLAQRLIARHPMVESGYALLMQVQERRGNRAKALLTFDRLRTMLREELGVPPPAAVVELHERLLRDDAPADAQARAVSAAPRPPPALFGRTRELDCLRAAWADVCRGDWRLVRIMGEPGIGKTALTAHFADELRRGAAHVAHGRCDEEPVVPYQPFAEALDQWVRAAGELDADIRSELGALAHFVPEARRVLGAEIQGPATDTPRHAVFNAVTAVLRRWAAARPVLLTIDDLHWADKPTLLLLRHVLGRSSGARLLVLVTMRDDASRGTKIVTELRTEDLDRVWDLCLDGLGAEAADAMIATRVPERTHGFARVLRAKTDGNPFLIEHMLRSLEASGALAGSGAVSERVLEQMDVPDRVQSLTIGRLADIPTSRDVVEAAAVIARAGGEFDVGTLQAVVDGADDAAVIDALEEAMDVGLIAEVPQRLDTYRFCHALLCDAVYAQVRSSRRVRCHADVAAALAQNADAPAAQSAYHAWLARHHVGTDNALAAQVKAAEEAASALAYEDAAGFYQRAISLLSPGAATERRRCELLLALGRVRWQAGDRLARDCYRAVAASALDRHDSEQLARAALGLGERSWEADPRDLEVRGYLRSALELLDREPSVLRARLLALLGENQHFTAEAAEGAENSREALLMARTLVDLTPRPRGARSALVSALVGHHIALLDIDHLEERLALIREAAAMDVSRPELAGKVLQWRIFDCCEVGARSDAMAAHAELAALADALNQPVFQHIASAWRGTFAQLGPDLELAEQLAGETYALGRRANTYDAWSTFNAQLYTIRRRQLRTAEMLGDFESLSRGPIAPVIWRAALAVAQHDAGLTDDARAGYEWFAERGFPVPRGFLRLATLVLLAELCARLGDAGSAPELADKLERYAACYVQVGVATSWGSVARYLGLLAAVRGDLASADRHLAEAVARNEAFGAQVAAAEATCDRAALLAQRGERSRALELAAEPAALARAHGLTALVRRVEAVGA
jgi:DNA-binding SARP family transcriptional activator